MSPSFLGERVSLERDGIRWLLNPNEAVDRAILDDGAWEIASTVYLRGAIKRGWVCLDVGANIGYFSVLLAKLVGSSGDVIAIEPMDEPFAMLVYHRSLNNLYNLHTLKAVASDRTYAPALFEIPYSCPREGAPGNRGSFAPSLPLDKIAEGRHRVDFIKIDTDGHEPEVLRGAQRLIERDHPLLMVEIGDWGFRHYAGIPEEGYVYGTATRELLTTLSGYGYHFWDEHGMVPVTADTLLARHDLSRNTINLFCAVGALP